MLAAGPRRAGQRQIFAVGAAGAPSQEHARHQALAALCGAMRTC